jgi:hypothetical protein
MRGVARKNGTASTGTGRNDLLGRQSAATTALQKVTFYNQETHYPLISVRN